MKNIFEPFREEPALKVTKEQEVKAPKTFYPERYNMLLCPECKGKGKITNRSEHIKVCPTCGGFGCIRKDDSRPGERRQKDDKR
jgi:DnaJ-class molecular chaperone